MFGGNRGWFLFKYFGRKNVRVLNGGLPKWVAEERETLEGEYREDEKESQDLSEFKTYKKIRGMYATYADILAASEHIVSNADKSTKVIVDSREADWFNGQPSASGMPGGNIPGSVNLAWKSILNEDRTFKSVEDT